MSRGLLRKILLETWPQLLLFGLAVFTASCLLTLLILHIEPGIRPVLGSMPIVRMLLQAMMGCDLGGPVESEVLRAVLWVHPAVLALLWAQELVFCTRVPAGEVDRGTIDILLSWPISRRKLFGLESLVWLTSGVWMCLMLLAGHLVAIQLTHSDRSSLRTLLLVLCNLYGIYFAVGGVTCLVSSISNRRGRALGTVFGLLLASYLLSFLAQFWPATRFLAPLGVLNYYRPTSIVATGHLPWADLATLIAVGGLSWLAALETFARRTLCTL